MRTWTFPTNHAHVLICIAQESDIRLTEIAQRVGITERAAQRIVNELVAAGYLSPTRVGRRSVYTLHPELPLRHPLEQHVAVGALLAVIAAGNAPAAG